MIPLQPKGKIWAQDKSVISLTAIINKPGEVGSLLQQNHRYPFHLAAAAVADRRQETWRKLTTQRGLSAWQRTETRTVLSRRRFSAVLCSRRRTGTTTVLSQKEKWRCRKKNRQEKCGTKCKSWDFIKLRHKIYHRRAVCPLVTHFVPQTNRKIFHINRVWNSPVTLTSLNIVVTYLNVTRNFL